MAAYHPFSETESKAPAELAVCLLFLVLTYLSVGARCWVRTRIIKSFGWDDGLMVVALIFFSVYCLAIIVIAYKYGGGTRVSVIGTAMHWIIVSETFYVLTAMMLKLSLGIFFLRIIIKPWQRAMVYAIMVLITLTSVFFFFFLIFLCGDPKDYLIRYIYDRCAPRDVQVALAYLSAALGTFADWMYALLPIQIVLQANMDFRSKMSVLFILSLGTVGSVCSTVRLRYIEGLVSPSEFFWNAAMIAIWSGIECGAGITAGSLATLRPLIKRWFASFRSMTAGSLSNSSRRRRNNNKNSAGNGNGNNDDNGGSGSHNQPRSPGDRLMIPLPQRSLPSKSTSSGQATDGSNGSGSSGGGVRSAKLAVSSLTSSATRPTTAWPTGCYEKLAGGGGGGASSSDRSHTSSRKRSEDNFELKDLSREPSTQTLREQQQQQQTGNVGLVTIDERERESGRWDELWPLPPRIEEQQRQRREQQQQQQERVRSHPSLYDVDLEMGRPFTIDAASLTFDADYMQRAAERATGEDRDEDCSGSQETRNDTSSSSIARPDPARLGGGRGGIF